MMENMCAPSWKARRIGLHAIVGYVLILLSVGGFGPSMAEAQDPAPGTEAPARTDIVRSIEFEGNAHFKDKVLGQRIGVELGDQSDPFQVEGARRTIVDLYKKKGYIFVQVAVDRDMAEKGQLFFTITEGARVRVKTVRILGTKAISSRNIKKVIKTKTRRMFALAAYYSEDKVAEDVETLREFYYDRGYLGYAVETATEFVDNNQAAVVTFTIDERPWQLSITEQEDRATYIVIYDTSNAEKPRLVMFNKMLLLE